MEKAKTIAEGAAKMTGCSVQWSELGARLDSMKRHPELEEVCYRHSLEYLPKATTPDQGWARNPEPLQVTLLMFHN